MSEIPKELVCSMQDGPLARAVAIILLDCRHAFSTSISKILEATKASDM